MSKPHLVDELLPIAAVVSLAINAMVALDVDGSIWRHRFENGARYERILITCINGHAFKVGPTRVVECYPIEVSR